jgi:hypothetical protein
MLGGDRLRQMMSYGSEMFPALPVPPVPFAPAPIDDPTAAPTGDWMPPATVDPTAAHVPAILVSADAEGAFDAIFSELTKAGADDAGILVNSDLLRECNSLRDRVLSRLTEQRTAKQAGLGAERDAAYATCRALLDSIEEAAKESGRLNSIAVSYATGPLNTAAAKVTAISQQAPVRSSYPSRQEIESWRNRLFAAEHELAGKQAEHNELRASVNVVLEEWQRLKRELAAAQQIEQRLTAQLEGKAYRDPKLGLYVAPTI